jgi:hypothetical protein
MIRVAVFRLTTNHRIQLILLLIQTFLTQFDVGFKCELSQSRAEFLVHLFPLLRSIWTSFNLFVCFYVYTVLIVVLSRSPTLNRNAISARFRGEPDGKIRCSTFETEN